MNRTTRLYLILILILFLLAVIRADCSSSDIEDADLNSSKVLVKIKCILAGTIDLLKMKFWPKKFNETSRLYFNNNVTLEDGILILLETINASSRQKRQDIGKINIETCFHMIRKVDFIINILQSGHREGEYQYLSLESSLEKIIKSIEDCEPCDSKELDFLSYQIGILESQTEMLEDFIKVQTMKKESALTLQSPKISGKKKKLNSISYKTALIRSQEYWSRN